MTPHVASRVALSRSVPLAPSATPAPATRSWDSQGRADRIIDLSSAPIAVAIGLRPFLLPARAAVFAIPERVAER
jgi:hypothetical protein